MNITLPSGKEVRFCPSDNFESRELMNPTSKTLWVRALRSGKYPQGRGRLFSDGAYCCLGVKCAIDAWPLNKLAWQFEIRGRDYGSVLPSLYEKGLTSFGEFQGFTIIDQQEIVCDALTVMNDKGYSFEDIAFIIDKFF
jgi:hypothetical protein